MKIHHFGLLVDLLGSAATPVYVYYFGWMGLLYAVLHKVVTSSAMHVWVYVRCDRDVAAYAEAIQPVEFRGTFTKVSLRAWALSILPCVYIMS